MFWPVDLIPFYVHPENRLEIWRLLIAAITLIALTAIVIVRRKQNPYLLVGWLWYIVMLISCHWNRAGWLAGPRRPLHLSSPNRIGHRARLVGLGSDQIMLAAPERLGEGGATTKNWIERCRRDRSHHVVELVLETNDALA